MVEKMHSMGPTGRQNSVLQHEGPMDLRVYSELRTVQQLRHRGGGMSEVLCLWIELSWLLSFLCT